LGIGVVLAGTLETAKLYDTLRSIMSEAGEATEVDAEALNSENVYWIDYRKDRHFLGSELRNGRFKVQQFVHASEVSSVGLVWEGRDKKKNNMRVAIKTPKAPATPSDWPSNWCVQIDRYRGI
jgi:hypothetical protein